MKAENSKFTVSSHYLLKQLTPLISVVNVKITDVFSFELNNNILKVSATNLETTISADLIVDSEKEESKFQIPAKQLINILKSFKKVNEQNLIFSITYDNIEIEYTNGKYSFCDLNKNFPETPCLKDSSSIDTFSNILNDMINKTVFAAGKDEIRPVLSGVFFQLSDEKSTFVATDACRLVKYVNHIKVEQGADFIVPAKSLKILSKILGKSKPCSVGIEYDKSYIKFTFNNYILTSRLIDGKYPNYEAVIPKENPNKLIINRLDLLNSLRNVTQLLDKINNKVTLDIKNGYINIFTKDNEENIICDYTGNDIKIAFNYIYFIECLKNLDSEKIVIKIHGKSSIILKPFDVLQDSTILLMQLL